MEATEAKRIEAGKLIKLMNRGVISESETHARIAALGLDSEVAVAQENGTLVIEEVEA